VTVVGKNWRQEKVRWAEGKNWSEEGTDCLDMSLYLKVYLMAT